MYKIRYNVIREKNLYENKRKENRTNSMTENNKPSEMISGISEDVMDALVRTLLPDIISLCESEEGKAIFEKWRSEQTE